MKELSIKEKAKAYDEVREKIALRFGSNVAEEIFSEFEMNEDERIRKEIISIVKSYRENCITEGNHKFDDCLGWLEKQGEQQELFDITKRQGYKEGLRDGRAEVWSQIEKQGEQKPAWSEEDEMMLNLIIQDYEVASRSFCGHQGKLNLLESLKPNHWKPSEEEIEALEYAAAYVDSKEDKEVYRTIKSLLDELKTLRNNK